MHVCKYAIVQVCKYAGKQLCMYACMQVWEYASMQVCKYVSMQVCKYASMQVCKYEIQEIYEIKEKKGIYGNWIVLSELAQICVPYATMHIYVLVVHPSIHSSV